ncbi:hypothetical protein Tco_0923668 [Tanacetum coccineum]|uniref:Uncharacterized protein n=1 Tax=Tanacetum coccineum TaxID=301880 RepID=A0ABQ5D8R3_9ASTR
MVIGMQYLNTNSTLYEALLKADKDECLTSEEVQRVARDLCDHFETSFFLEVIKGNDFVPFPINIKIGKDMLPQQLYFFDVELEEGLKEGLEEVQGQLDLDELHLMEKVQVGLELDEVQGLQEYLVQELELDEGTRSVGRECVKEDKRPDSSWHGLVLD